MDARLLMSGTTDGNGCSMTNVVSEVRTEVPAPANDWQGPVSRLAKVHSPLDEIVEVAFPADPAAERENGCRFLVGVQANSIVPPYDLMAVILN